MIINELMNRKNISKYRLSKMTDIPYMTINDLCNEKTNFRRCPAENVYKIAKALDTTVEFLMEYENNERADFDLFKSQMCHRLKEMGDVDFMIDILETNQIQKYSEMNWMPECLYLLAMLDYLSRINNFPLVNEYENLRKCKLRKPIYPSSVVVLDTLIKERDIKAEAFEEAIPEFRRFNIVESEIRNVI